MAKLIVMEMMELLVVLMTEIQVEVELDQVAQYI
jgi:hypothetical protein